MAWTSIDFTKCMVRDWEAFARHTVTASKIAGLQVDTRYDNLFCVHEPPSPLNTDTDWSIRGEFTMVNPDSWWAGGLAAMQTNPGSIKQFTVDAGADHFNLLAGVLDTTGGNAYKIFVRSWDGTSNGYQAGSSNLSMSTKYYWTFSYDADGGAGGVGRLTLTFRTTSHSGSVHETITHDLASSGATYDVDLPYLLCAPSYYDPVGGSNDSDFDLENVEVDFTASSDDQSEAGSKSGLTDDFTTYTASQTPTRFDITADKLENIGSGHGDHNKESDQVLVYLDFEGGPVGAWTAFQEVKFDASEQWYTHGYLLGLADVADTYKEGLITGAKNGLGVTYWTNGSSQWVIFATEVAAGSETSSLGTGVHTYNRAYWIEAEYDPTVGTYGTLYGRSRWGHWDALTITGSVSVTCTQTPQAADLRYWFGSQSYEANLGGGARFMGIDQWYLWRSANLAPPGTAVAGIDAMEFGETGERYSVAAARDEDLRFSEAASEVGELNVGAPTEGVEFSEAAGLILSVSAADALELGDSAHRAYEVAGADQVDFDEDAKRVNFAKEDLTFGEAGAAALVVNVEAVDGITFEEGAAYLPLEGCETDFVPSPPIQDDPSDVLYVYLLGPWATMEHVMRLPRPDFGDVRRSRLQVMVHRTRGGQRRVYKRTPTYRSLILRFRGLSRRKLLELEAWLENTAGEDVRLIDWEGRVWRGNVLTSPADLSHEAPDDGEALLEFEGETVTA